MKQFLIEVPEGITEDCIQCPFNRNKDVCLYFKDTNLCNEYNLTKLNIEEYTESTC